MIKSNFVYFIVFISLVSGGIAFARKPMDRIIHLREQNDSFLCDDSLEHCKSGRYKFIITNESDRNMGFQIQNSKTHENLGMLPCKAGETRSILVEIPSDGWRFRCPVTPTKWYEIPGVKISSAKAEGFSQEQLSPQRGT